jgi:hypothetical protein
MNPVGTLNSQAEIFGRALDKRADRMPADVAHFIISIEVTAEDAQRLDELADKARQGTLSEEEETELEEYRRFGRLMEMMKLKARIALKQSE